MKKPYEQNMADKLRDRLNDPEGFTVSFETITGTRMNHVNVHSVSNDSLPSIEYSFSNQMLGDRNFVNINYIVHLTIHDL